MLSRDELIASCQKGKKESQYELVKRYSGQLMTVCRRYARDNSMAKDILQESFIRIFRNIRQYKPTGSFEGWMHTITVRCALQWIDKSHLRHESNAELIPESSQGPDIYSDLALEDIMGYIQELSPGLRAVFNLNVIEGYSHKEIGELLDIAESTSRANLLRARKTLIKRIESGQLKKNKAI